MSFGLQSDPSQDYSQVAPRERPNALARRSAIGGALNKGGAWDAPPPSQGSPGPTRTRPPSGSAADRLEQPASRPDPTVRRTYSAPTTTRPPVSRDTTNYAPNTEDGDAGDRIDFDDSETNQVVTPQGWAPPANSLLPNSSKNAPRITQQGTQYYLTEHGNRRALGEGDLEAAQNYVTDFWRQNPTGFQEGVGPQSNEEYNALDGIDQSGWDTDSYAAPAYIARDYGGVLNGWNEQNWNDPNMQTPKYVGGRIFSKYDPNDPAQVQAMVAEIQQAYPGAEFDGKDKLSIPGVGTIDIIVGAGAPGATWAWQPVGAGGDFGGGTTGNGFTTFTKNQQMGGDASSILAQILPGLISELGLGTLR